ncbi:MAG TPA: helix-turn-helix transcriptional regulator [Urbifossiella sp.]|nr:helix-turn-helix transcriptional regulator [Urbifossiella sp.]
MAGRGDNKKSAFGKRLKELREKKGWSKTHLAEQAGLHLNTILRLENGDNEPAWPLVLQFAGVLGVSCTEFTEQPAEVVPAAVKPAPKKPKKK